MTNPTEVIEHLQREKEARYANFNTELTQAAMEMVFAERRRQVQLGREGKIPHACEAISTGWGYRLGVLMEEVGEISTEVIEGTENSPNMLKECIQTAAVALACAEGVMRRRGYFGSGPTKELPAPRIQKIRCPSCGNTTMTVNGKGDIFCSWVNCKAPLAFMDAYENGEIAPQSEHMKILMRADRVRESRNATYKDVWKNYGWRGCLVHARTCAERAFVSLWAKEPGSVVKVDNLIDLINYAAFAIRSIDEGNRDGTWQYPED